MRHLILALSLAAALSGQSQFPNAVDTTCTLLVANDLARATLAADVSAGATSFTVTTASTFSNCMVIRLDDEQFKCNVFNPTTRVFSSCTPGFAGTTPANHSATNAQCSTAPYPGCVRGIISKTHHEYVTGAIVNIQSTLGPSLQYVYQPTATIDYKNATATSPFKAGTSLPASCGVGESFFKSDATPGQNIYVCTATNTWTAVIATPESSTTSGIYVADFTSQDPLTISNATHGLQACPASVTIAIDDGTNYTHSEAWNNWSCVKATYQVTIDFPAATSGRVWLVRGSGAAAGGSDCMLQVNVNGTLGGVSGTCVSGSTLTITGAINVAGGTLNIPHSATLPVNCNVGDSYMDTDDTTGERWNLCESTDTWVKQGSGGGGGAAITVGAGAGLYIATVDGIKTLYPDPAVLMTQGGDNEATGTNSWGMGTGFLSQTATNDGTTGTEQYKLVSMASTGLIRSSTATNDLTVGVCYKNCGTTGTAEYVRSGIVPCVTDNATTFGNYQVRSTTASGQCHDSGVASSSGARPAGFIVGISNETAASSGTRSLNITGSDIR